MLTVNPQELKWEFEEGQQVLRVTNSTNSRFAIKVKCTDNEMYRFAQVLLQAGRCFLRGGYAYLARGIPSGNMLKGGGIPRCDLRGDTVFSRTLGVRAPTSM
ncbi:unnamed protein product [Heligmosomoides polygyrus]|uniref:MSP domain-containing protein n=1 Tax=Heligmosomoides polygyrus TaxID=6339 RepID=A0A183FQ54_HELPZ|nr:unnamed protein product [Heligmosomoides polygyrus]